MNMSDYFWCTVYRVFNFRCDSNMFTQSFPVQHKWKLYSRAFEMRWNWPLRWWIRRKCSPLWWRLVFRWIHSHACELLTISALYRQFCKILEGGTMCLMPIQCINNVYVWWADLPSASLSWCLIVMFWHQHKNFSMNCAWAAILIWYLCSNIIHFIHSFRSVL